MAEFQPSANRLTGTKAEVQDEQHASGFVQDRHAPLLGFDYPLRIVVDDLTGCLDRCITAAR